MWELDCEEGWMLKNWCFCTVVLEKTLESPLDCKEIQPVHPKGDQSWVFIGRTDAEAETPILWPPHDKSWLIGKDSDARRDWGQEEKGTTEDEMAGWHHWLSGNEFEWTPGVGDGQGGVACCDSWGRTQLRNWTELSSNMSLLAEFEAYITLTILVKAAYLKPSWTPQWTDSKFHTNNLTGKDTNTFSSINTTFLSVFYSFCLAFNQNFEIHTIKKGKKIKITANEENQTQSWLRCWNIQKGIWK